MIGGSGSPILLVHGFPETWYAWCRIMPLLAKRHTLMVPDLRGTGALDKPAGPYDTGTMAEDLHQLVLQLGYREIDVVGHDVVDKGKLSSTMGTAPVSKAAVQRRARSRPGSDGPR